MEQIPADRTGYECLHLGNEAVVRGAIEAGVQFASCYPGTPASEIGDTFARLASSSEFTIPFEYSVNEKVALEVAFGASLAGARAIVSMKHLGLNYAGDPLSTIPYVGVVGGLVIVAAGDPSLHTSPNEQDHRHFARMLHIPTLDPATPQDALEMTRFAFELSEETLLPVLLRITTRVSHVRGIVQFGKITRRPAPAGFKRDSARFMPVPAHAHRLRLEVEKRLRKASEILAESPFNPRTAVIIPPHRGAGRLGIIASGVASTYAADALDELQESLSTPDGTTGEILFQKIGVIHPLDERLLADFIHSVDRVLVLEELTPYLEDTVHAVASKTGKLVAVWGKRTNHLPACYEYSPDIVKPAIRAFLGLPEEPPAEVMKPVEGLPVRPPSLCPGCPHRASFYLIREVFGKETLYFNDIGCYTLGFNPPLCVGDALLCMGSCVTQAAGVSRMTGQRTVAVIGDSTFYHSGMPGLLNAVQSNDNVLVVILNNMVTGMTGFQPSLASERDWLGRDTPEVRFDEIARALGVREVETIDPFDLKKSLDVLHRFKASRNTGVVVSTSPCPLYQSRVAGKPAKRGSLAVDRDACSGCNTCIDSLGCPAFLIHDGEVRIEEALCTGCGLCAEVCPSEAVRKVSEGTSD